MLPRVELQQKAKKVFVYRIIKKFTAEDATNIKWEDIKSVVERDLKSTNASEEDRKKFSGAVCTGQDIFSVEELPFLIGEVTFGGKPAESHVKFELDSTRNLELPRDIANINYIIGQAFEKAYIRKGSAEFVESKGIPIDANIEKFVTFSPSVVMTESKTFLEMNVRWSLAPAGNTWWHEFKGWKSKSEEEKKRLLLLIKSKHARTKHFIKKNNGPAGVTILGVVEESAGDRMNTDDESSGTFKQYFQKEYSMNLQADGPVFKCRIANTRKRILYPAETLQPLFVVNVDRTKLPSMYPPERMDYLQQLLNTSKRSRVSQFLDNFGLSFSSELVRLSMNSSDCILSAPKIYFPSGRSIDAKRYPDQLGFIKELNPSNIKHSVDQKSLPVVNCDNREAGAVLKRLQEFNVPMKAGGAPDIRKVIKDAFYLLNVRNPQTSLWKDMKIACGVKGALSQGYYRQLLPMIVQMIALQMIAKLGIFNYTINLRDSSPRIAASNTLFIGVDVGPETRSEPYRRLVTVVAFYTSGEEWSTWCNHSWVDVRNSERQDVSVSKINEAVKKHLTAIAKRFETSKSSGTLILMRAPCSSGELPMCFHWTALSKEIFGKWKRCVLGTQARGMKLSWDVEPGGASATDGLRNVPRGFWMRDNLTIPLTVDGVATAHYFNGFRICGANCVLGHANSLLYLVFDRDSSITEEELRKVLYALCYMYPNMPGALPVPLPIKAAAEYNKKFGPLQEVKQMIPSMAGSMHYL